MVDVVIGIFSLVIGIDYVPGSQDESRETQDAVKTDVGYRLKNDGSKDYRRNTPRSTDRTITRLMSFFEISWDIRHNNGQKVKSDKTPGPSFPENNVEVMFHNSAKEIEGKHIP